MIRRGRQQRLFARLPIRARLTIGFVAVMAAVLAGVGLFLYAQFEHDIDSEISAALTVNSADVEALVDAGRVVGTTAAGIGLAQVYAADGSVVGSSAGALHLRLLTTAEAVGAARRSLNVARRSLPSGDARVYAVPAMAKSGALRAVAVAEPLTRRDRELSHLRTLLVVLGPLALLLATVAGYELARAALRPVDRMRVRSDTITERDLSDRLPVSASNDEIAALGRTLNAMLDRVEAAVTRERRLVSDASHELRTPLTTLRAEVDLALLGDRSRDELRAALVSVSEEARRMSRLADDLLVLARADQGRLPLHTEPFAARDALEAAAARSRAAAEIRGRRLTVRGEAAAGIEADPDRTAQALDNLVKNALLYGEGTITLAAREDGEVVELHVTDEGAGFPAQVADHPFERFERGQEARGAEPGSGLGLALVQAIATAHGGHAGARHRPEGGADVWIALPRARPTDG
jgi:two-component system, OmpR family, sensor kinase